jgi:hypothetical protein
MVAAEYHSLANEPAPDELNHAVLYASRKALDKRPSASWQSAWLRPLATVAVIALSLTVILEFNDANNADSPLTAGGEIIQLDNSPDVFREAADNAAEQFREAEAAASRASQNSAANDPPATDSGANIDQTTLLSVDQGCDEVQRSTTGAWWKCIESLENRGASALAEQELAVLLRSYPAFVEPGQ